MGNKKGIIIGLILGLVLGLFVTGLAFKIAAPTMFFKEVSVPYDFDKTVRILQTRINQQEGWQVTETIDKQKVVLDHGGKDVGKINIIQYTNPQYASDMLKEDSSKFMAVKMTPSIAVYEKSDGRVYLGLMNGAIMAKLFSGRQESVVMEKMGKDMEKILGFLHVRNLKF